MNIRTRVLKCIISKHTYFLEVRRNPLLGNPTRGKNLAQRILILRFWRTNKCFYRIAAPMAARHLFIFAGIYAKNLGPVSVGGGRGDPGSRVMPQLAVLPVGRGMASGPADRAIDS